MIIKPCLNYKPLLHSSCLMNPTTQTYRHPAPHDGVSTNISLSPYSETTQGLRGLRQLGCLLASSGDLLNQDQSQLAWEMCQFLLQAPRDSLAFFAGENFPQAERSTLQGTLQTEWHVCLLVSQSQWMSTWGRNGKGGGRVRSTENKKSGQWPKNGLNQARLAQGFMRRDA